MSRVQVKVLPKITRKNVILVIKFRDKVVNLVNKVIEICDISTDSRDLFYFGDHTLFIRVIIELSQKMSFQMV